MKIKRTYLLIAGGFFGVIFFIYLLIGGATRTNLQVVDTYPRDKTENVILNTNIEVLFNHNPSETEKTFINFKITPEIDMDGSWISNKYTIKLKRDLEKTTTYTVTVYSGTNQLKSFSFKTMQYTVEELNKIGYEQSQADYESGQLVKDFIGKNPWYPSLPIYNENYTIVYDFDRQQFRIRIKISPSTDAQKQQFTEEALEDLRKIGVTSDPIPYYVLN